MKKIIFFVPVEDAELVKEAMFEAGAGRMGNYEKCSFEMLGTGQFRPIKGANPTIGKVDQIERVKELRIEMICDDNILKRVVMALKESHPYEEPAFDIIELFNL